LQNLAPGLLDDPHEGHRTGTGVPHESQNLAFSECSDPQLEHRIEPPGWRL